MRIKWALVHFKPNSANKRSTLHSAPPDHLILKFVTRPLSSSPNRKEREEKRREEGALLVGSREKLALRLKMTKRNLRSKESTIGEDAELLFQKKIRDLESVNESLKVFPSSHYLSCNFLRF